MCMKSLSISAALLFLPHSAITRLTLKHYQSLKAEDDDDDDDEEDNAKQQDRDDNLGSLAQVTLDYFLLVKVLGEGSASYGKKIRRKV